MARRPNSRWCQKDKRVAVYIRDGFTCLYCGTDMRQFDPRNITLDHLEPRLMDQNGKPRRHKMANGLSINDVTNLVTACRSCNCSRGARAWRDFAPGGAQIRILHQIQQPTNYALARSLISGTQADLVADVETR